MFIHSIVDSISVHAICCEDEEKRQKIRFFHLSLAKQFRVSLSAAAFRCVFRRLSSDKSLNVREETESLEQT